MFVFNMFSPILCYLKTGLANELPTTQQRQRIRFQFRICCYMTMFHSMTPPKIKIIGYIVCEKKSCIANDYLKKKKTFCETGKAQGWNARLPPMLGLIPACCHVWAKFVVGSRLLRGRSISGFPSLIFPTTEANISKFQFSARIADLHENQIRPMLLPLWIL